MDLINKLLLAIYLFSFASCVNYEQETVLSRDGSGSMNIHYWTKNYNIIGEEIFGFGFTESKVRENFSSPEIIIKKIEVTKLEVDSTTHVSVEIDFKNFNHLPKAKSFRKVKPVLEHHTDSLTFSFTVLKDSLNAIKEGMEQFKLFFEFDFPGKIENTNGIKTGSKARWEFTIADLQHDLEMNATIDNKPGSCGVFGIEMPVLVLTGIFLSLHNRARRKSILN